MAATARERESVWGWTGVCVCARARVDAAGQAGGRRGPEDAVRRLYIILYYIIYILYIGVRQGKLGADVDPKAQLQAALGTFDAVSRS